VAISSRNRRSAVCQYEEHGRNSHVEFHQVLPLLTLYHTFPLIFARPAEIRGMLPNGARFLSSFEGKYLYFFPGEMQI
jgi:hypothetical protein